MKNHFSFALIGAIASFLILASNANAKYVSHAEEAGLTTCYVTISPPTFTAGQKGHLNWNVLNASSITFDQGLAPATASELATGSRDIAPTETTTYTVTVTGKTGTVICRASAPMLESKVPTPKVWPLPYMSGLDPDYLDRKKQALSLVISKTNLFGNNPDWVWMSYGTASLLFGQDVAGVNKYMSTLFELHENTKGNSLQSSPFVRFYGLFNSKSPYLPGRLIPAAQQRLLQQMYNYVSDPARVANHLYDIAVQKDVWLIRNSENHDMTERVASLMFAQYLKNDAKFGRLKYDGHSPAEHYQAWVGYFMKMLDEKAKRGLFTETGSSSYEDNTVGAVLNVRDFVEDPILRKKAEMLIDLQIATMVEDSLHHVRGGARSRMRPQTSHFWGREDSSFMNLNLLFGSPDIAHKKDTIPELFFSSSNYAPAEVLTTLDHDSAASRGRYEFIERRPSVLTSLSLTHTGAGKWARFSTEESAYRYGFATPGYIMGSADNDPLKLLCDPDAGDQPACYGGGNVNNRWQGIIFGDNVNAFIATRLTRFDPTTGERVSMSTNENFLSLQDRNVLITQKRGNKKMHTEVYFSSAMGNLIEEDGWIFMNTGTVFGAVKVVDGTYAWASPDRNMAEDENIRVINLSNEYSPIIMMANEASDYQGDFAKFKAKLKAASMTYSDGHLSFATLDFYGMEKMGEINGVKLNNSPDLVFNSPFIKSKFGSGYVVIHKGVDSLVLDFRDTNNPQKISRRGSKPAGSPAGVGTVEPIVFGD